MSTLLAALHTLGAALRWAAPRAAFVSIPLFAAVGTVWFTSEVFLDPPSEQATETTLVDPLPATSSTPTTRPGTTTMTLPRPPLFASSVVPATPSTQPPPLISTIPPPTTATTAGSRSAPLPTVTAPSVTLPVPPPPATIVDPPTTFPPVTISTTSTTAPLPQVGGPCEPEGAEVTILIAPLICIEGEWQLKVEPPPTTLPAPVTTLDDGR